MTLQHLYHLCPDDLRDETIYPLNELARRHPDLHRRELGKWEGREGVLRLRIPHLDAAWGDTVNLSPIHPHRLLELRASLGLSASRLLERSVVAIPVDRILLMPAVWYQSSGHWMNSRPGNADVPANPPPDDFTPFEATRYRELTEVPHEHAQYLRAQRDQGEPALGLVFVPHVLVLGAIDVTDLPREQRR